MSLGQQQTINITFTSSNCKPGCAMN